MIRRLVFLGIFIAAIVLVISSPYIAWKASSVKELKLVVYDTTVPYADYNEHGALMWTLNHLRYPAPDGHEEWSLATDYVGYYPSLRYIVSLAGGISEAQAGWNKVWRGMTDADLGSADVLYLADTYGVYDLDLQHIDEKKAHLMRNPLVTPPMQDSEMNVLERFLRRGGAVIAEFNTFALPTTKAVRTRWENAVNVDWTNWIGRYVDDLADERDIPWWVFELWRKNYQQQAWHFSGPGFIFVDTDEHLVVLQVGEDVADDLLRVHNVDEKDPLLEGTTSEVPYYYWFDIVMPRKGTTVHSEYVIDVTPAGKLKLDKWSIPSRFPAVMSWDGPHRAFYFAGDFADQKLTDAPYAAAWYPAYRRYMGAYRDDPTNEWFFWEYYLPLMENVLSRLGSGRTSS